MARKKNSHLNTGSPESGEPVFLAVGFLRRPHGLAGEMVMDVLTDFPERLVPGKTVYAGEEYEPLIIRSVRSHKLGKLIAFEDLTDCDVVARLRTTTIFTREEDLPPLPKGEYYFHQLLGISVYTENDEWVGVLSEILETGANDVYLVTNEDGEEILLPAIDDVVLEIDLQKKIMRVCLQDWL